MARKKKAVSNSTQQLGFMWGEDEHLFGSPSDILRCEGAKVAVDTETTGLCYWRDRVTGLGIHCPERGISKFIMTLEPDVLATCTTALAVIANNPETQIRVHNGKFDFNFMNLLMPGMRAKLVDTGIAAHLVDSRLSKRLGDLEQKFLGTTTKKAVLSSAKDGDVRNLAPGVAAEYCLNDCRITFALADKLAPLLAADGLTKLFWQQMRYEGLLQKVERRGMLLDLQFASTAANFFLRERLLPMERELFEKAHRVFNWRSPEQLGHALYEGMDFPRPINPFLSADGIDHTRFATRGKYNKSATSAFLLMEKAKHPLGSLVMAMRETDKLLECVNSWIEREDHEVIHTDFNPTGTRTGRLSSSKPNMQNVASDIRGREILSVYSGASGAERGEYYNLRHGIVARPGYKFVSIDYKQQEMRMFAILAQDPEMIQAIKQREDIHAMIAKAVWAADIARDPSLLTVRREWSKTIAFGLIYGMTTGSLQHRLNKTRTEANKIVDDYQKRFPRIHPFLQETIEHCKQDGFVKCWSGRIWREEDPMHMYKGCNAMVQGGSADLLSEAALRADNYIVETGCDGGIVSSIHDELLFELRADCIPETAPQLARLMEVEDLLGYPFATDIKIGGSYGTLRKWSPKEKEQP